MKRLAALFALFLSSTAYAEPHRVVSLNPCLDTLLVHLADRAQIAALSHFARDPISSSIADIAATIPITHESAEEVMSFAPDLVLTSRHSSLPTRNALRSVNIKIELFSEPKSVAESIAQVRTIAALVNREARGEALVTQIEAALAEAAPPPGNAPVPGLVFQANGFSTGDGTLVDEMLRRTGFTNVAKQYGLKGWGNIPLERVVADPPAILLAGVMRPDTPTWADRILRHPALHNTKHKMKVYTFPDRLIYCSGPVLIKAAAALREARQMAESK
jgi:iron complex transport system substrate-binding protein